VSEGTGNRSEKSAAIHSSSLLEKSAVKKSVVEQFAGKKSEGETGFALLPAMRPGRRRRNAALSRLRQSIKN
jgi:hypothetical protein